jgi:hypothetical protein
MKGSRAIDMARTCGELTKIFVGQTFWARGYFLSTVGRDEAVIRETSEKRKRRPQDRSIEAELRIATRGVVHSNWGRVSDPAKPL